ncbi:MAG: hypothetical protein A3G25_18240 [Betaproteobacteria bacterium RIFCSPLOWO2_12_FULL_63_13]|nr:MAG: hypothetical protein A3H32_17210 [Betaproteobacteria bacterium RIFCSPLOWO2_02_FULL_63_19]OGA50048.1 MAG: hypothetical protein A3G25_18240 [Betaproteobacteria bacterium RIFCSPLOWO2_12_FULL_63_13]
MEACKSAADRAAEVHTNASLWRAEGRGNDAKVIIIPGPTSAVANMRCDDRSRRNMRANLASPRIQRFANRAA